MDRTRALIVAGLAALAPLCTLAAAASASASSPSPSPMAGAWQRREYQLEFVGYDSRYSCDWLKEKIALLLKASGARPDFSVTGECREYLRPAAGASAHMVSYALAPAAVGDRGDALPSGETRVVWRKVVLRDHSPLQLRSMDCELVRQFREQLLPLFTTRLLVDRSHCRPGENSPGDLDLEFEVLVAGAG